MGEGDAEEEVNVRDGVAVVTEVVGLRTTEVLDEVLVIVEEDEVLGKVDVEEVLTLRKISEF